MWKDGRGVPADAARAFQLYEQAAALGHEQATFNVALTLRKGELGTADKARGLELMVRAASGETAELAAKACEFLGIEHLSGTGSPSGAQGLPSFAEAERWLRRGAELGSASCRSALLKLPALRATLRAKGLSV